MNCAVKMIQSSNSALLPTSASRVVWSFWIDYVHNPIYARDARSLPKKPQKEPLSLVLAGGNQGPEGEKPLGTEPVPSKARRLTTSDKNRSPLQGAETMMSSAALFKLTLVTPQRKTPYIKVHRTV